MKKLLTAVAITLSLFVSAPAQAEWFTFEEPTEYGAYAFRPLSISNVVIKPESNIRVLPHTGSEILGTTNQLFFASAHTVVAVETDNEGVSQWVEISFTVPGDLNSYSGYVHESRIQSHNLNDEITW